MNNTILAATGNKHKIIELKRIMEPFGFNVITAEQELLKDIIENGETFSENSLIKSRAVFNKTGISAIADDSGICIDYLKGAPGVYSARFLGEATPYEIKNREIIKLLSEAKGDERKAHYECVISIVTKKGEYTFHGRCDGFIGYEPKGENGFGYDPIFYCEENKSYSELTNKEKDAISHRGNALRELIKNFKNIEF